MGGIEEIAELIIGFLTIWFGHSVLSNARITSTIVDEFKNKGYMIDWEKLRNIYLRLSELNNKSKRDYNPMYQWLIASLVNTTDFKTIKDEILNHYSEDLSGITKVPYYNYDVSDNLFDVLRDIGMLKKVGPAQKESGKLANLIDLNDDIAFEVDETFENLQINSTTADVIVYGDWRGNLLSLKDDEEHIKNIDKYFEIKVNKGKLIINQKSMYSPKKLQLFCGLSSDVTFNSLNIGNVAGSVEASGLYTGRLYMSNFSGQLSVRGNGITTTTMSTVTGSIYGELFWPSNHYGILAKSYVGIVEKDGVIAKDGVIVKNGSIDLTKGAYKKKISAHTISGNIEINTI